MYDHYCLLVFEKYDFGTFCLRSTLLILEHNDFLVIENELSLFYVTIFYEIIKKKHRLIINVLKMSVDRIWIFKQREGVAYRAAFDPNNDKILLDLDPGDRRLFSSYNNGAVLFPNTRGKRRCRRLRREEVTAV